MNNMRLVGDFVTRWFRDSADRDYICARGAYRNEFNEQFRSCALNAVQKYLTAILLFNGRSARHIGPHDVLKALESVSAIEALGFEVPADVALFIQFLDRYGADRYMHHPDSVPLSALLTLDKSVWHVRSFCLRHSAEEDGLPLPRVHSKLQQERLSRSPHKFRIADGFLERVIHEDLPAYRDLTWKNSHFGRNRKPDEKRPRFRVTAMTPVHSLSAELFEELRELVDFPQYLVDRYAR